MAQVDYKKDWADPNSWETPACPFCGSEPKKHIKVFRNVNDTKHDLVECPKCKFRFYSPRLKFAALQKRGLGMSDAAKKMADLYYENTGYDVVEDKEVRRQTIKNYYKMIFQLVIDHNGLPASMFEVGGACGFFLDAARDMGVKEFAGVDLNRWHMINAKKYLGFDNMWYGEFDKYYNGDSLYDCAVMLDYIEHSYTPYSDLKKIAGIVRAGGSLLLKTFLEELDIDRTMAAPVGHANHFFGHVLRSMLESVGFEILCWKEGGIMVTVIARKKTWKK